MYALRCRRSSFGLWPYTMLWSAGGEASLSVMATGLINSIVRLKLDKKLEAFD